jgi:hypothetical protein
LPIVGGGELGHRSIFLRASHREEIHVSSMKKEEASGPQRVRQMGEKARMKSPTFSIFVRLATRSGKSFTAGFGIGWKIRLTHPSKAKGAVPFPEG